MSKKVIAFHTWEPGIEDGGNLSASSGGASWLSYLIEVLVSLGHQVIWLCDRDVKVNGADVMSVGTLIGNRVHVDTLVMPWRWKMGAYPDRDKLYGEQFLLAAELACKMVIHDEDHMMSFGDTFGMKNLGAILTTPAVYPPNGFDTLHFPNPFELLSVTPSTSAKEYEVLYVGNNYGRFDQTEKFLNASNFVADFFGNWLESGPGRESPEEVVAAFPNAAFHGRLPNTQVVKELSKAFATIHLCKKSYADVGFLTMRWAEAAEAGIIAFIPREFRLSSYWSARFESHGLLVRDAEEMRDRIGWFRKYPEKYKAAVEAQQLFVLRHMATEPWLNILIGEKDE